MSDFMCYFFFFKQKTAYEMRISDWSSDVCSSDLTVYMRGVTPFRGHLIIEERVHGLDQIRLRRYSGEEHRIAFPEASYTASLGSNPEFAPARSEERRVGKECVSTCSSRGVTVH